MKDKIGHVQISQAPLRDCPMHPGELDFDSIFKLLNNVYNDYIGLEYFSNYTFWKFFFLELMNYKFIITDSVDDNFEWVKKYAEEVTDI